MCRLSLLPEEITFDAYREAWQLDATGGVRIASFYDPDGVLLEFIQGDLQYDVVGDEALVAAARARPTPAATRFDHVAGAVDGL